MKQAKQLCHFLFATLLLSCGLTPAFAQNYPPAVFPIIPELPSSLPAPINPEWVNCDMYNYNEAGQDYFLLAFAYDDLTTSKVYYGVYDSKTMVTTTAIINDAKHPDIVLGDFGFPTCSVPGMPTNINCSMHIIYEDLNNNKVASFGIWLSDVGTASFAMTPATCATGSIMAPVGSKNPHIDLAFDHDGWLEEYAAAYEVPDGGVDKIRVAFFGINGTLLVTPSWTNYVDEFIDQGIRPDICYATIDPINNLYRAYLVYYKNDFSEIKRATIDYDATAMASTWSVTNYPSMESNIFYGYPRIDGPNIFSSLNTPWYALAEVVGEASSIPEIHGYYNAPGITIVPYGMGCSPTVTIANGSATLYNPLNAGNDGYAAGFDMPNYDLEAVYLDEAFAGTVVAGYNQVNFTPLSTYYGVGKNLFAMTSSTNTGENFGAAWFDGANIRLKLVTNSFAFKPTTIQVTQGKAGSAIYPNPATDKIQVRGHNDAAYTLTDITGRQLQQGRIAANAAIDISTLPRGIYLLHLDAGGIKKTEKFTKE